MIKLSKVDKRIYKHLNLSNKLQCLLIEDKEAEKSAAALNVQVGAFQDPRNAEGLAHFCEHMLFMGTTKYPDESEYQHFISKHSGMTNAYTSSTNTNYFFTVANDQLEGALDRFSQFFKYPLFKESCIQREMKAVHSEFNMNLQNDFWRKFQISKLLAPQNSSYSQFMIGNLDTLGQVNRQQLIDFHSRYYSSNLMKLVIYGKQSVEQLENWAIDMFSDIPNKNYNRPNVNIEGSQIIQNKLIKIVPINDEDHLDLIWVIDYLHPHFQNCPGKYIAHLIGHEGEGSLLSYLIKENLAYELQCGTQDEAYKFSELYVSIKLTKKGLAMYQHIIELVFNYINILQANAQIFNEVKQIKTLQFDYLEKQNPFDFVGALASRLHQYPVSDILKAPYLMENFDSNLINKTINQLNRNNLNVFLQSQQFQGKLGNFEKYFGSEYEISDLQFENQQIRNPNFHLPNLNKYLPNSTDLFANPNSQQYPTIIYESPYSTVYFKQDNKFNVPKTFIKIRQYLDQMGKSIQNEVLGALWQSLLTIHLRELFYEAEVASLSPSVSLVTNGIEYSLAGFSDSINKFLPDMLKKVLDFKVENYKDNYDTQLAKLICDLENFSRSPPYSQARTLSMLLLRDCGSFDPEDLLKTIRLIQFDDLIYFQNHFMDKCRFEWLIMGNIQESNAVSIVKQSEELFKKSLILQKEEVLQVRSINIPENIIYNYTRYLNSETETNSSVILYFQLESGTVRNQLIVDLLSNIIKTPFFSQLRTKEQLGYVVFSASSDVRGITGFQFLIQSSVKCPKYLQARIREFIKTFGIDDLTREQFEEYKQSIRVSLLEKDFSLGREVGRFWGEIQRHQNLFDRREQALSLLDNIDIKEVKNYYKQYLIEHPHQIEIHVVSPSHKQEQDSLPNTGLMSTSVEWIKRRVPLYPDMYSLL
ncbi:unnamed protein product [Paramecium primaurelia]|uniref:Insulin-degrading enzyme n=1 Tax=Paramecium primaurelia TaxID=5886 RepID=A0A8S1KXN8_PARPR|nr:unnamed protein product [Paramecium primaurelia]